MKLTFRLRFHTEYGQSLLLTGNHEALGGGDFGKAVPLHYVDPTCWEATIAFPGDFTAAAPLTYSYLLRETDGFLTQDWCANRLVEPAFFECRDVLLVDTWNDASLPENIFYTEPFRKVLLQANQTEAAGHASSSYTHWFQVRAPLLGKGQTLCLLGSSATFGRWSTDAPILLRRTAGEDCLTAHLDLRRESFPIEYKYGVFDVERGRFVRYEDGQNRLLQDAVMSAPAADTGRAGKIVRLDDGFAVLPATTWRGAGVAIPVFSLRSQDSCGVGEFADLKLLADWCQRVGLKVIQVLPVNDTTATRTSGDSYPYSAISAFALHPLYLRLAQVASPENQALLVGLEKERQRLNKLEGLDYAGVMRVKSDYLKRLYPLQKRQTFASADYQAFFQQNQMWLVPYAAFSCLRDRYHTPFFEQWPEAGHPHPLMGTEAECDDEMGFHYFLQYHLHLQLREAADYAHSKGVILKGDIAIGVSPCGADAWQNPELYHLEMQAGAPPDAFAAKGQNWGFPTYNWPRMQQDGFAWWKQRFGQMARYFDAFRIDHILGFFRIWSIPRHAVEGLLGYFVHALPVEPEEFVARGIPFEPQRFARPFINGEVLTELFGDEAETVRGRFLEQDVAGNLCLKPEFATQRQVAAYFERQKDRDKKQRLEQGLYDLISNVLLLEVSSPEGRQYHFRFGIEGTSSFRSLPAPAQAALRDLYIDYFFRRQDAFWMREGMEKLPALKRVTNLLVCGEDLGMVPDCVPVAMKRLGLLSLEVQRMPKDSRHQFSRPARAPYLSVVTPSTHDMSTIRGWWEEDRRATQTFFNQELGRAGPAPYFCEPWVNQAIVAQHLASPAMWSIFQLQDLLGMDGALRRENPHSERINVPADPKHRWDYRMHLNLEDLCQAEAFNDQLKALLAGNGR